MEEVNLLQLLRNMFVFSFFHGVQQLDDLKFS